MMDIARDSGVSISTVSHVINKTRYVKRETIENVIQSARKLGYFERSTKSSSRSFNGTVIGVVVADIREDYYNSLVKTIESVGIINDCSLLICDSQDSEFQEQRNLEVLTAHGVSGIILCPVNSKQMPSELNRSQIPVILVDRQFEKHPFTFVGINNLASGWEAFRFLRDKSCKSIGFVGYSDKVFSVEQRKLGYAMALHDSDQGSPRVLRVQYEFEDSVSLIERFVTENALDGVICATSDVAYQVVTGVTDLGMKIPEDICLLTYDDNRWFDFLKFPVNVVVQPIAAIGNYALERLIELINGDSAITDVKQEVFFDYQIVER